MWNADNLCIKFILKTSPNTSVPVFGITAPIKVKAVSGSAIGWNLVKAAVTNSGLLRQL